MDSGNSSGSIQSTSGDDEEYDSRAESSFSAFLNNSPSLTHVGPFSNSTTTNLPNANPHPLPPQHHHNNNTHMFDPLSNYLDPIQRHTSFPNPNSLLNLDVMWSKPARSEPNPTDLGSLIPCSSSSTSPQNQAFVQTRGNNTAAFLATHNNLASESGSRGLLSVSAANNDQANNTNMVRNPKKRSRASRRAPTTVLTTDTTNFRAMVQEFTGIPAPPFPSSSFPRSRFDLFGSASTSTMRSTHLDPPYLLRPFAHKLPHLHPFPPSSSMMDTLLVASNNSTNSTTNSTSIDHLGLLKQPHQPLNFNMHNPVLNFQTPPKYPLDKSSVLVSKTQTSLEIPPSSDSFLKMGVFEELGLRHDRVNANVSGLHQNMVSSPSVRVGSLSSGNNNLSNASTAWAQRTDTITNNDCGHGGGAMMSLSGTDNYSNVTERDTNGKVHYSASSSDFHGEKGPECTVAARSEGMVESWINCSSD
ncbi:uncharacterized protein LOC133291000 [Gastrolobium bilobum]|uniref:uncharacterized protein LOC133291000 n=1 Tax=Gastrolobium bilobum TaxID=150636 RepID=UPI002AB118C7|nr:uncharacterized protein LOC133291000 [Gastrolobium bilobum]